MEMLMLKQMEQKLKRWFKPEGSTVAFCQTMELSSWRGISQGTIKVLKRAWVLQFRVKENSSWRNPGSVGMWQVKARLENQSVEWASLTLNALFRRQGLAVCWTSTSLDFCLSVFVLLVVFYQEAWCLQISTYNNPQLNDFPNSVFLPPV